MLTPTQITAQSQSPALTDDQVINIMLLVKQYPVYLANLGLFPGLEDMLAAEKAVPTVKTKVLKAVLAAVDALPEVVVESQGRTDSPSHFTSHDNWNSLALDVLNTFFSVPANLSHQSFALANADLDTLLNDPFEYRRTLWRNLNRLPGDQRRLF